MAMIELHPSPDKCRVEIEATHQGLLDVGNAYEWRQHETNGLLEKEVLDDTVKRLRKAAARR
jgi:hypothetical protein